MTAKIDNVAEAAQRLTVGDRIRLVGILLASLDPKDPGIDRAWIDECERRLDAYDRGEMSAVDAADVLGKHLIHECPVLSEAADEFEDAVAYHEERRIGLGQDIAVEVRDGIARLTEYPTLGRSLTPAQDATNSIDFVWSPCICVGSQGIGVFDLELHELDGR